MNEPKVEVQAISTTEIQVRGLYNYILVAEPLDPQTFRVRAVEVPPVIPVPLPPGG